MVRNRGNDGAWGALVFMLCAGGGATLLLADPGQGDVYQSKKSRFPYGFDPLKDLVPGSKGPDWLMAEVMKNGWDPNQLTLVIYAGSCSECTLKSLTSGDIEAWGYPRTIVIFEAGQRAIDESFNLLQFRPDSRVAVVPDPDGSIKNGINAAWVPRYFLYENFRLVGSQQSPDEWPPKRFTNRERR